MEEKNLLSFYSRKDKHFHNLVTQNMFLLKVQNCGMELDTLLILNTLFATYKPLIQADLLVGWIRVMWDKFPCISFYIQLF